MYDMLQGAPDYGPVHIEVTTLFASITAIVGALAGAITVLYRQQNSYHERRYADLTNSHREDITTLTDSYNKLLEAKNEHIRYVQEFHTQQEEKLSGLFSLLQSKEQRSFELATGAIASVNDAIASLTLAMEQQGDRLAELIEMERERENRILEAIGVQDAGSGSNIAVRPSSVPKSRS